MHWNVYIFSFFTNYPQYQKHFRDFKDKPLEELKGTPKLIAHGTNVMMTFNSLITNLNQPQVLVELLLKTGFNHGRHNFDPSALQVTTSSGHSHHLYFSHRLYVVVPLQYNFLVAGFKSCDRIALQGSPEGFTDGFRCWRLEPSLGRNPEYVQARNGELQQRKLTPITIFLINNTLIMKYKICYHLVIAINHVTT